jgi:hypothetical protein
VDFVRELYEISGIKTFFFDELHKYPKWNQEVKNLYDTRPDIKIIFSGSSSIDCQEESIFLKESSFNLTNSFRVKDDINLGGKYDVPLHFFGFLY